MYPPLQRYGPQSARLLCPRDSPGKNTGVGYPALLQGIFLTQALAGSFFATSTTWEAVEILFNTYFPGGSDGKASACNAGDPGLIPGLEDPLEKEMATHSSILAWRILWIEEPGRLQSMGSQKFGHN